MVIDLNNAGTDSPGVDPSFRGDFFSSITYTMDPAALCGPLDCLAPARAHMAGQGSHIAASPACACRVPSSWDGMALGSRFVPVAHLWRGLLFSSSHFLQLCTNIPEHFPFLFAPPLCTMHDQAAQVNAYFFHGMLSSGLEHVSVARSYGRCKLFCGQGNRAYERIQ